MIPCKIGNPVALTASLATTNSLSSLLSREFSSLSSLAVIICPTLRFSEFPADSITFFPNILSF